MKISDSFKNTYMKCDDHGNDNVVIVNCPPKMLIEAMSSFESSEDKMVSCLVMINERMQKKFSKTLETVSRENHRDILACDYINLLIAISALLDCGQEEVEIWNVMKLLDLLKAFDQSDTEKAKENHCLVPMQYDVDKLIQSLGRVHLVILLEKVEDKYIYRAINNYLGSRCRYPISVFTTEEMLGSSYMSNSQLVQPIHDYRLIDMEKFIEKGNEVLKKAFD